MPEIAATAVKHMFFVTGGCVGKKVSMVILDRYPSDEVCTLCGGIKSTNKTFSEATCHSVLLKPEKMILSCRTHHFSVTGKSDPLAECKNVCPGNFSKPCSLRTLAVA
jgi:hypothetical protein